MSNLDLGRKYVVAAGVAILVACSAGEKSAEGGGSGSNDSTKFASVPGALSDPNIFFILDNANFLDSAAGALAATKGTSAEIRQFGKLMARDHHGLMVLGQALSKRLAITPESPAGDDVQQKAERTLAALNAAAKGKDFDKAYIDEQVSAHRALLEKIVASMRATQNSELKNLIQKTAPTVQAHLDKAQSIQKNTDG